jgi:hypothetical protein
MSNFLAPTNLCHLVNRHHHLKSLQIHLLQLAADEELLHPNQQIHLAADEGLLHPKRQSYQIHLAAENKGEHHAI